MVCYHFPPMGTTGALRPARLLRYLPADIAVQVLTVRDPPEGGGNEALWREIAARVDRREAPLRPLGLQRRIETALAGAAEGSFTSKVLKTLGTWLAWIPDRQVAWVQSAIEVGATLADIRRPDVILCSAPPHSLTRIGAELKRRCGAPLVLDFRDPWSDNPERIWPSHLHRGYERRLEAAALRAADLVLANTPGNRRMLLASFPWLAPERVVVLPNGFDRARRSELAGAPPPARADGRRVVLYAGHVYAGGASAIEALAALLALDSSLPRRLVFRFAGSMDPAIAELCEPLQRAGLIERVPAVPAERVPGMLAGADALFYVVPAAGRHWIPSKLYEYLVAGRPVLGVLPRGDAWDVLVRSGTGVAIEDAGPERVAHELRDALERLLAGELVAHPDEAFIAGFDAAAQAAQLARWLRKLAGAPEAGAPSPVTAAAGGAA